jgi:exonuclease VII small subunit
MSNTTASNVISMREFDRQAPNPQEAQFERLLKECQVLATERLSKSISTMLDKVEDALWGLADQTQDRELRDLYITTKDKALQQRKRIEEQFRDNYIAEFASRVRPDRKQREDFSRFDASALELGLVNDEDLDETIKVNEMAAKLRRYCEEELNALDQRVGVLIGDANLQGEGNPFSPQAICTAYKQTCRQIEANLKVRMILHRLFDDHVLDDVRSIYKDLNALLIQRSILPKIRYGIRRQPGGVSVRPGLPAPAMQGAAIPGMGASFGGMADAGYGADAVSGGEQDFYAVLQGLISMNAQGAAPLGGTGVPGAAVLPGGVPGGSFGVGRAAAGSVVQVPGFPPIVGGPVTAGGAPGFTSGMPMGVTGSAQQPLQGAELIGSLTRLQQGDFGVIAGAPVTLDASVLNAGTTNVVRELKSTRIGNSVDQTDATTMDIVAMLFDQIFSDKRVPYALKVLIGRLQIPVVKVAVLDKKFFSKKSHPARRLLNTLGEFALGLDDSFDQNSPVYQRLEGIVQRLLDGFEDDIEIFETLNEDLLVLVREENQRAENAAKEAARKIAYMERLEVGKALAQFEIKKRAEASRISQLVLTFLADEWVKLLLLAYARHGNDSDAWKSALETMDLLIWSVNHKQSVDERRKLAAMLPGLLKRLQAGLQGIGTDPDRRRRFFARLMRLHTKVISGTAPAKAAARTSAAPTLTNVVSAAPPPAPTTSSLAGDDAQHGELPELTPPSLPDSDVFRPSADRQGLAQADSPYGEVAKHQVPASPIPSLSADAPNETGTAVAPEIDLDAEPATEAPQFSNVTIKNPFGGGEIEIEEISLSDLPGVPEFSAAARGGTTQAEPADQHSQSVTNLKEGDWLDFHDDDGGRIQAKLSYISPLKGTYLFVNRQGARVGEYSLYQLAREFRTGRAVLLEAVPLLDRAMSSLVGMLKKSTH